MMNPTPRVSLSNYTTMRLGGIADYLLDVHSDTDVIEAYAWAKQHSLPVIMIGGGSNIYWQDDGFRGLVIVNKILTYKDEEQADGSHLMTIGAGEPWDSVVARSVQAGLTGIEALSLIPGSTGGTPIQNVGAYGQQISDVLVNVRAYDTTTNTFVTIEAKDCQFSYRNSRFKSVDRGRFLITHLTLQLRAGNPLPPYYSAIQHYLEQYPTAAPITPATLRDIVITIRQSKLPDPAAVANNGSFFANPIIASEVADQLRKSHPDMPCYPSGNDTYKIPAAWLIEHVGFKGYHDQETGMATWDKHALVLVNEHARTTSDLIAFKHKIVEAVEAAFGITLEQEPELLPHTH